MSLENKSTSVYTFTTTHNSSFWHPSLYPSSPHPWPNVKIYPSFPSDYLFRRKSIRNFHDPLLRLLFGLRPHKVRVLFHLPSVTLFRRGRTNFLSFLLSQWLPSPYPTDVTTRVSPFHLFSIQYLSGHSLTGVSDRRLVPVKILTFPPPNY